MNETINNMAEGAVEEAVKAMPKTAGSGNIVAFVAWVSATLLVEGAIALGKKAYKKAKAKK